MPVSDEDGTIRLTGPGGEVLYEGPGRITIDQATTTDGMDVLPGVQELEDGDPRSWGISFDRLRSSCAPRPGEPTMEQAVRWAQLLRACPEEGGQQVAAEMAQAGIHVATVDATMMRASARRALLEAYGLPESVLGVRPRPLPDEDGMREYERQRYDERERLMAETRAEFPPDRYDYGRFNPEGPMRWTPPENGEEVPSCPA